MMEQARALARMHYPDAPATYRTAWRLYLTWCARHRLAPWPVHARVLVTWLGELERSYAPATVRKWMCAVGSLDVRMRAGVWPPVGALPIPVTYHPIVKHWLRGFYRRNPLPPKR